MDLTRGQYDKLRDIVTAWLGNNSYELETTFGVGGVVNSNVFLQIAQRMRTKGFELLPQEDYLNIITPNNIRFTLQGLNVVESYCKDNLLENKVYKAMMKNRTISESNIDLEEYNIRFKVRREDELQNTDASVLDITNKWDSVPKAFRLIRRWSFKGNGYRIDMSTVRQTPIAYNKITHKNEYKWSTIFQQYNILKEPPRYEVEVELLHDTEYTNTVENAIKSLIVAVGEVQRAIQKNTLLIRNSVVTSVLAEYEELVGGNKFRGVGPVTMQLKNMTPEIDELVPNIRSGYNVTDKADGLRTMGFVDKTGELFLIDQSMNVYRTGLKNEDCASSLVDGEWVTMAKDGTAINHYLLFDIYYNNGEKVSQLPFVVYKGNNISNDDECRYNSLQIWNFTWKNNENVTAISRNQLQIILKNFEFPGPNSNAVFTKCCAKILDNPHIYHTDGLIITSNSHPIPDKAGVRFPQQFKWKPAKDNTVDFLIIYEKDDTNTADKVTLSIHSVNGSEIRYKTMRLYVGAAKGVENENPRATILSGEPIVKEKDKTVYYRPVLFTPMEYSDTMANTCNVMILDDIETEAEYVVTEDSKEPIPNRSVVEMRYEPSREPGWRWVPSRIRHDKTERLVQAASIAAQKSTQIKYSGIMNDEGVANDVWNSIHDPITISMIRSGNLVPSEEEMHENMKLQKSDVGKKYYERKASKEDLNLIKGLQGFHNKIIKNKILIRGGLLSGAKRLVDMACGKAGDLYKWYENGAKYVLGIDTAGDNITNTHDGAYKRYMQLIMDKNQQNLIKVAFAIGNSSKNIISGEAGVNAEERDILRIAFAKHSPEGPVPKYISTNMNGIFREGADVAACMFALHYFFETKETLDGFLNNLDNIVKIGGYFIGCCFDGDTVFKLLKNTEKGKSKSGIDGDKLIWTITKEYDNEELIADDSSIGLGINVEFISIGSAHREFLVPFKLLISKLAKIGFKLVKKDEFKSIALSGMKITESTDMFKNTYNTLSTVTKSMPMIKPVEEFSFLNRWFIFKRYASEIAEEQKQESEDSSNFVQFSKKVVSADPSYKKLVAVESSGYSVLKPWHKKYVTTILHKWFPDSKEIVNIIDATAHIGVDSLHLSDTFPDAHVDSYEIVKNIYNALVKNIKTFGKESKITPHNADITVWTPTKSYDLLFVDPPWGGVEYHTQKKLNLYLQKEGDKPDPTKNIYVLIDKWLATNKIHHIMLKAPENFNRDPMVKYSVKEEVVLNKEGNIAYNIFLFTSSTYKRDEPTTEVEEVAETPVVEESKESKMEGGVLKANDVFRFGPKAIDNTVLKDKDSTDINAARYISPSMYLPEPIPDRNNKDILYPTIDHYMAAMRIKLSSPEHAIEQLSTKGAIHQKALGELALCDGIESEKYYNILYEENKQVKKYKLSHSIELNDSRWVLEKDDHLRYALTHRWKKDARYKALVTLAKKHNKYLLYNIEGTNAASEYSGIRTMQGTIKGENKMGKFIMNIAKFDSK